MSRQYSIADLIFDNEEPRYSYSSDLRNFRKYREIKKNDKTRYLTWVDDQHVTSIKTPNGRELTREELFDFIIGKDITDLAKSSNSRQADVAIVLGNAQLPITRERAIKAFELYKRGIVPKIIFTGGIRQVRDKKGYMHPGSLEEYMDNSLPDFEWQDLPEADWGAETFVPEVFDEEYNTHKTKLTKEFLENIGVKPEDIITEAISTTTQENAAFCKNIFDILEIETGEKVKTGLLVTTVTHGARAMRQFSKLFGDRIKLSWCPATLDLEKYGDMKEILSAHNFDVDAFRKELKRIYCTVPELTQKLIEETANHRNAFILGDIDEPFISVADKDTGELEL